MLACHAHFCLGTCLTIKPVLVCRASMVPLKAQLTKLHDQEASHQLQLETREARLKDIEVGHNQLLPAGSSVHSSCTQERSMWMRFVCVLWDCLLHIC